MILQGLIELPIVSLFQNIAKPTLLYNGTHVTFLIVENSTIIIMHTKVNKCSLEPGITCRSCERKYRM